MVSFYQPPADGTQHAGRIIGVTAPDSYNPRYLVALSDTSHPVPVEAYAWAAASPEHQAGRQQYTVGDSVRVTDQGGVMTIVGLEGTHPGTELMPNSRWRFPEQPSPLSTPANPATLPEKNVAITRDGIALDGGDGSQLVVATAGIRAVKNANEILLTPAEVRLMHIDGVSEFYLQTTAEGLRMRTTRAGINTQRAGQTDPPPGSFIFVAADADGCRPNRTTKAWATTVWYCCPSASGRANTRGPQYRSPLNSKRNSPTRCPTSP